MARSREYLAMGIANAVAQYDWSKVQLNKRRNRDVSGVFSCCALFKSLDMEETVIVVLHTLWAK